MEIEEFTEAELRAIIRLEVLVDCSEMSVADQEAELAGLRKNSTIFSNHLSSTW